MQREPVFQDIARLGALRRSLFVYCPHHPVFALNLIYSYTWWRAQGSTSSPIRSVQPAGVEWPKREIPPPHGTSPAGKRRVLGGRQREGHSGKTWTYLQWCIFRQESHISVFLSLLIKLDQGQRYPTTIRAREPLPLTLGGVAHGLVGPARREFFGLLLGSIGRAQTRRADLEESGVSFRFPGLAFLACFNIK